MVGLLILALHTADSAYAAADSTVAIESDSMAFERWKITEVRRGPRVAYGQHPVPMLAEAAEALGVDEHGVRAIFRQFGAHGIGSGAPRCGI